MTNHRALRDDLVLPVLQTLGHRPELRRERVAPTGHRLVLVRELLHEIVLPGVRAFERGALRGHLLDDFSQSRNFRSRYLVAGCYGVGPEPVAPRPAR